MPSSASHGILQADGLDFALLSSIACSTRFVPCDHATMRATDRPTIDARYVYSKMAQKKATRGKQGQLRVRQTNAELLYPREEGSSGFPAGEMLSKC